MSPPLRHLSFLPLLLLVGCGGGNGESRFTVRDSTGVMIAESTAARWTLTEGWSVDTVPLLNLGTTGEGPAHEFSQVVAALRLPDGSVMVADAGSRQVRKFSPEGQHIWSSGRQGDGPGEHNQLRSIALFRGDSILAYDYWLGRATLLSADGHLGRVFNVGPAGLRPERVTVLDDTLLIAEYRDWQESELKPGLIRPLRLLARVTPAGVVVDTIARVPGHESVLQPNGDDGFALFGRTGHTGALGGALVLGSADDVSFTIHGADGRLQRIVRVPTADLRLSAAEVAREREAILAELPDRVLAYLREVVASLPTPTHRPGYDRLVVDAMGAVWLRPHRGLSERGSPYDWQVFSAEGEWLGTMVLPERFRVYDIGADYILGVGRGEFDVEEVQLLRLSRE